MPFVQPPVCELDVSLVKGEAQPVAEETAFYTRCDQNRHMNNTYYADIVCDHVPLERIAAHAPARLAVVHGRFLYPAARADRGERLVFCRNGRGKETL